MIQQELEARIGALEASIKTLQTNYLLEAGAPPVEGGQVSWIHGRYDNQFVEVVGR